MTHTHTTLEHGEQQAAQILPLQQTIWPRSHEQQLGGSDHKPVILHIKQDSQTHKHKAVSKLELQESKLDRIPSKSRSVLQISGLGSTTPEQQGKTVYNPHCSHINHTQRQKKKLHPTLE